MLVCNTKIVLLSYEFSITAIRPGDLVFILAAMSISEIHHAGCFKCAVHYAQRVPEELRQIFPC